MFKKPSIKLSIIVFVVLIALVSIFVKLSPNYQTSNLTPQPIKESLVNALNDDQDSTKALEYFSVFKFVNNFNPSK
jgi:hypothetical protein